MILFFLIYLSRGYSNRSDDFGLSRVGIIDALLQANSCTRFQKILQNIFTQIPSFQHT